MWLRYLTAKRRFYLLLVAVIVFLICAICSNNNQLAREAQLKEAIGKLHIQLEFMNAKYTAKVEEFNILQVALRNVTDHHTSKPPALVFPKDVSKLLKKIVGSKAASGAMPYNIRPLRSYFSYLLMPHLLQSAGSLTPSFHMAGKRTSVDIVIGIPTVRREKESYLMITLQYLLADLTDEDANSTLIVVMVGETDLKYVINVAKDIENNYQRQVDEGLIEVIAAPPSYYPDLSNIKPTLGDSLKRTKWRTKQNLDAIFLMAYAQTRGLMYLMLEDDVVAKPGYMTRMKTFISKTSVEKPNWMVIEFCNVGGIGKMFRTTSLIPFITYVQLFYTNMPIDWLVESFLSDKICTNNKISNMCKTMKLEIRPRYNKTLFAHIGLFSSLKGKIHSAKGVSTKAMLFFPHNNPPCKNMSTTLQVHAGHTLESAYAGDSYFWAKQPDVGDTMEFIFTKPILVERYLFRSANLESITDKFYDTDVQVLPLNMSGPAEYVTVGDFDEFGLAEGEISKFLGPIVSMRLYVKTKSKYWVILSEIHIQPNEQLPS